jgi:hypothetical protein
MGNLLAGTVVSIITWLLLYFTGVGIEWDFDPSHWHIITRGFLVTTGFIFTCMMLFTAVTKE